MASSLSVGCAQQREGRTLHSDLRVGDEIRVAGKMTELVQAVESLHIEHQAVEQAARGAEVVVKVREPVRRHDQVHCVRMGEQTVEEPRARLCLASNARPPNW